MDNLKYFLIFIILIVLGSCEVKSQEFEIKQNLVENAVICRLAKDNVNNVIRLQFPNELILKNNSVNNQSIVKIDYIYNHTMPVERDLGIGLFERNKKGLSTISTNGKKTIPSGNSKTYLYYTRHYIDSAKSTQEHFKAYLKKMLEEGKDTLHIGSVAEFKMKHKEIYERLTKNDSITIQFLAKGKLGEKRTEAVSW